MATVTLAPLLLLSLPVQQVRFLALFLLAGYCLVRMLGNGTAGTYLRFDWTACRVALPGILLRSAIAWLAVAGLVWWLYPDQFLCLPQSSLAFTLLIVVGYGLVSVLPQEIAFRGYAGWRLDGLNMSFVPAALISAAIFGWVHIIFGSWISAVLAFFAGIVFYRTYRASRSLAAVWVEHTLFGAAVFVLGLHHLFYRGPSLDQFASLCMGNP
ncbi:CPBP family intramembrane glutamic endopeptidase [Hoeflea poritis]|uniref:CPBP family intramembrane metalloprotease n=1 Tax=Hoeflea poritis TaxID=2993659 RepID=A0ABT4VQZ7_9HYPH|nr:CPBP family intramembrane glutamic endopeptidase [Hoeflea poritis]MDA4847142.1 CPBP family intramembrane metalloprotease [Hoeflea poritis]